MEELDDKREAPTYFELKKNTICEQCGTEGDAWRIYNSETLGIELCLYCFRRNYS